MRRMRRRNRSEEAENPTTVLGLTRRVIEKKGQPRCYALEDFARALDETEQNVAGKVRLYKWTALALLTLIPILSTFLSISIAHEKGSGFLALHVALPYASYLLTLLTLLNSIFNPGERFKKICGLGIKIGDIRTRALEKLEEIAEHGPPHPHDFVEKLRKELEPYELQLIDLFLPEVQVKSPEQSHDGKAGKGPDATKPDEAHQAA